MEKGNNGKTQSQSQTVETVQADWMPTETQRHEATAGVDAQIDAYQQFINNLPKLETPEQRQKRERKERSKRIIGAVSDGLRAMSNLWFTSQYAPNMYKSEDSQLAATDARIEKLKAERKENEAAHLKFALGLGAAQGERARTLRELEAEAERRHIAAEKAKRDAELHPFNLNIKQAQERKENKLADKAGYDADISKANADVAPQLAQEKVASQQALTSQRRAAAQASATAAGVKGKTKHHFLDKEYLSDKDYEKDVVEAAKAYNLRHKGEANFVPIAIEDYEDTTYGKRRKPRKPEEYAGEVERRIAEDENDNRPPSRR